MIAVCWRPANLPIWWYLTAIRLQTSAIRGGFTRSGIAARRQRDDRDVHALSLPLRSMRATHCWQQDDEAFRSRTFNASRNGGAPVTADIAPAWASGRCWNFARRRFTTSLCSIMSSGVSLFLNLDSATHAAGRDLGLR